MRRLSIPVLCLALSAGPSWAQTHGRPAQDAGPTMDQQAAVLRQECAAGKLVRCVTLARFFVTDRAAAADVLKKACDGGLPTGCGLLYSGGEAVPLDLSRAAIAFQQACDAGDGAACLLLGDMYAKGEGVARSSARSEARYKRAVSLLAAACRARDGAACFDLGQASAAGRGVKPEADLARRLYDDGCQAGFAPACRMAAFERRAAEPIPESQVAMNEVVENLGQDCDEGADESCRQLAEIYESGDGVPKDTVKAAELHHKVVEIREKACDGGEQDACDTLGSMYWDGDGVAKDTARALAIWTKSCAAGSPSACQSLQERDAPVPEEKP